MKFSLIVLMAFIFNFSAQAQDPVQDPAEPGKPPEEMTLLDKSSSAPISLNEKLVKAKCPAKVGAMPFKSVSLFDGHPRHKVDLAPDNADSPLPHKWSVAARVRPWLVCNYGEKFAKLSNKKIKGKFKVCETLESKKGSGVYDSVGCK